MKMKKGFTLYEILIVTLIIGILGLLAIPNYESYIKNAKSTKGLSVLNSYKTIISTCITQNGNINLCSGGQYQIPNDITDRQSSTIDGIGIIKVDKGIINATIEFLKKPVLTDSVNSSYVYVNYTPVISQGAINWILSCSDFNVSSVVEGCTQQITP